MLKSRIQGGGARCPGAPRSAVYDHTYPSNLRNRGLVVGMLLVMSSSCNAGGRRSAALCRDLKTSVFRRRPVYSYTLIGQCRPPESARSDQTPVVTLPADLETPDRPQSPDHNSYRSLPI